jgi:hypothetical protein
MKRDHAGFEAWLNELAEAACFVLTGLSAQGPEEAGFTLPALPAAEEAFRNGILILPHDPCLFELADLVSPLVIQCIGLEPQDGHATWGILPWLFSATTQTSWRPWWFWIKLHLGGRHLDVYSVRDADEAALNHLLATSQDLMHHLADAVILAAYLCTAVGSPAAADGVASVETRSLGVGH